MHLGYSSGYIWLSFICCSCADIRIFPLRGSVVTLPSDGVLHSKISLTCGVQPPDYLHSPFWITPLGEVVDMSSTNPHYMLINGGFLNRSSTTTNLQINRLSYLDSGNYSCIIDSIDAGNPQRTGQAQTNIELQLLVRLNAVPNVTINITRETRADLSCEMFDYIPPDEHLQWTTNGAVLENSEKYTITYQDGNQATAQIGGNTRLPSRISTLTIHTPTINDSGEYVCAVMGTSQFVTVNLMVENTRTTSVQTIPTTSNDITYINGSPQNDSGSMYIYASLLHFYILITY